MKVNCAKVTTSGYRCAGDYQIDAVSVGEAYRIKETYLSFIQE